MSDCHQKDSSDTIYTIKEMIINKINHVINRMEENLLFNYEILQEGYVVNTTVSIVIYLGLIGLSDMIFHQQIENDVKTLYSISKHVSNKTFSLEQIKNLPEQVTRGILHTP